MRLALVAGCLAAACVVTGGVAAAEVPATTAAGAGMTAGESTDDVDRGDLARRTAESPKLLTGEVSLYPRAIRLRHNGTANDRIMASVVTFTGRGGEGAILESVDDGRSFQQVGAIPASEQAGTPGLCCASIFELPRRIGDLPAGTLLWAGSVGADAGPDRRMTQRVWRSSDLGRTWTYLSNCAESPSPRGMWEPEFSVDAAGRLVCHFADESEGVEGSQQLARTVSTDGVHWGPKQVTVQSRPGAFRPGMPVVRRLPDGTYLMVYEICGVPGQYDCAVYSRTSPDGSDWGDPTDGGTMIVAASGRYFTHTPTIAVIPRPHGSARIVLVGQLLQNADGTTAAGNGATLMVSEDDGSGPWREIPAPVAVPEAYNNYCPNYSSTLVPSLDGRRVLEIATDYADDGVCKAYFATGSLAAGG
ncbi:sialidase family protein [Actinopolymorpha sp. B17G11]|uniref:sialidase family protein n=1 Tax=Actinopolymorpha sp. B17G11 TaxID=3160861 RepID=UPI0032E3FB94